MTKAQTIATLTVGAVAGLFMMIWGVASGDIVWACVGAPIFLMCLLVF